MRHALVERTLLRKPLPNEEIGCYNFSPSILFWYYEFFLLVYFYFELTRVIAYDSILTHILVLTHSLTHPLIHLLIHLLIVLLISFDSFFPKHINT
jgi:hypothetical protein